MKTPKVDMTKIDASVQSLLESVSYGDDAPVTSQPKQDETKKTLGPDFRHRTLLS